MSEFMSPNIDNENQALWTPGKREVYKHYEAPRTRADQEQREEELYALREEYQRSIESYINAAFERGVGLAQYGAAMGKSMIRIYQTTGDIGSPDSPQYHRMMQRLQRDQAQLRKLLPENANDYISGILNEFAIADTLASPSLYNAEVYFPDESPNNYEEGKGVDWWVDMTHEVDESRGEKPYAIALQIKAIPFSEEALQKFNYRSVYPVRNDEELDTILTEVIRPENMHNRVKDITRPEKSIYNSMSAQLEMQKQYDNVVGALVLLPSLGGEASYINSVTGKLTINNPLTNPASAEQSDFWEQLLEVTPIDKEDTTAYNSPLRGK